MNLDLDVWSIGAILLIIGLAYFGIRMIRQRLDEQRYQEHMADLEFEASLLSNADSVAAAAASDSVFLQPTETYKAEVIGSFQMQETSVDLIEPAPPASTPGSNFGDEPVPAEVKAQSLMSKLQHAGFVRAVEGYVEVHGNAKGAAILRLRDGKLALLVPHMESESFLRHNARRVDMIIMAGTDGTAFVVRPMEQVLAESITLS